MDKGPCILCEFVNIKGKYVIGYWEWLVNKDEFEQKNIDLDQFYFILNLPSCGAADPSIIKKHVLNAEWDTHIVHIVASGGIYFIHYGCNK